MNNLIIKVITHSGVFHADEVFAVAMLEYFSKTLASVVRTRDINIINKGLEDRFTYVLDVGGKFDPSMNNFDHHHDSKLDASNMLIFDELLYQGAIKGEHVLTHMGDFLSAISDFDVNKGGIHQKWSEFSNAHNEGHRHLNMIIRSFNRNPSDNDEQMRQFRKAVGFAKGIIENEMNAAEELQRQEEVYANRFPLGYHVAGFDAFNTVWRKNQTLRFALMPNPQGWAILSRDSALYPLPDVDQPSKIFYHPAKFMIVFRTKEHAIYYVNEHLI